MDDSIQYLNKHDRKKQPRAMLIHVYAYID